MNNPIIDTWPKVFPGVAMTPRQERTAKKVEYPEVVAKVLASQAQGYRDNFDRILGPGIVTDEDIAKSFVEWTTSATVGHKSAVTLFHPLGYERAVELGKQSGDWWGWLYRKHLKRDPDAAGLAWWKDRIERLFRSSIK